MMIDESDTDNSPEIINFPDIQNLYQLMAFFSSAYVLSAGADRLTQRTSEWNGLSTSCVADIEIIHELWSLICKEKAYGIPFPDNKQQELNMKKLLKRASLITKVIHEWVMIFRIPAILIRMEWYYAVQMSRFSAIYQEDKETFNLLIQSSLERRKILYHINLKLNFSAQFRDFLKHENINPEVSL